MGLVQDRSLCPHCNQPLGDDRPISGPCGFLHPQRAHRASTSDGIKDWPATKGCAQVCYDYMTGLQEEREEPPIGVEEYLAMPRSLDNLTKEQLQRLLEWDETIEEVA